jgi:hypothetical protein
MGQFPLLNRRTKSSVTAVRKETWVRSVLGVRARLAR